MNFPHTKCERIREMRWDGERSGGGCDMKVSFFPWRCGRLICFKMARFVFSDEKQGVRPKPSHLVSSCLILSHLDTLSISHLVSCSLFTVCEWLFSLSRNRKPQMLKMGIYESTPFSFRTKRYHFSHHFSLGSLSVKENVAREDWMTGRDIYRYRWSRSMMHVWREVKVTVTLNVSWGFFNLWSEIDNDSTHFSTFGRWGRTQMQEGKGQGQADREGRKGRKEKKRKRSLLLIEV